MDKIDRLILEKIEKETVSGEELSKISGISRVAIWKRIKKLENLGYSISRSKNGYRLEKKSDLLTETELKINTKWLGKNYIFLKSVDSTNLYAQRKEFPDGTVILAEYQTAGRGRKGRKWISAKGKGLYFSIVLKKQIQLKDLLSFSLLFPVAVKNALDSFVDGIKIKWPNDLFIKNRKLAGFLIETQLEGNSLQRLVAGIGINVNTCEDDLGEFSDTATSLRIETGFEQDRKLIFSSVLESIEKYIDNFDPEEILQETERSLMWKGENVKIVDEGIEGLLIGLNQTGGVRILTDNGIKDFYSGDLTLRRKG